MESAQSTGFNALGSSVKVLANPLAQQGSCQNGVYHGYHYYVVQFSQRN